MSATMRPLPSPSYVVGDDGLTFTAADGTLVVFIPSAGDIATRNPEAAAMLAIDAVLEVLQVTPEQAARLGVWLAETRPRETAT